MVVLISTRIGISEDVSYIAIKGPDDAITSIKKEEIIDIRPGVLEDNSVF